VYQVPTISEHIVGAAEEISFVGVLLQPTKKNTKKIEMNFILVPDA